ncbi:hypothetical protein JTE90_028775 [Oedothorax gibbosus]|uniref:VWFA domain-containing protein n=1 Tax=Oedothorax gibbosus TaxID=931172 RepID=A0AAV6VZ34_9ARAC|nr:hypothetical protein JTE90_028775 [Oedothorax gibbosus]
MSSRNFIFLVFILLCILVHTNFASVITVEDKGYKGITVAIHKNVPEDVEIINNIKTLFQRASTFLYNSTKNSIYFREVTIIVPPTWSTQPDYEIQPGNFFSNAHVRIDLPNPEFKDTPYTLQPGGCGEPGQYIHLTPWFVKELNGETVEMFGAPERQLVHEWAHLRYGVFDEYGMPGNKRFPMFYRENGKIRPTSCVRDIKGWIESRDGGPCTMTANGEVDRDCIFIPNMHSSDAKASIMYMPFIPSMEGFCDDESHRHNVLAPTKHNTLCNYRSTWDVIFSHSDFQNLRRKRDVSTELTETLFRVLQSPKNPVSRYIIVLDVSGSMNGQPMKLLHSAATRLVEDRIPDGAYIGLVQFSTEASILKNMTKVDNRTRIEISRSLPAKDDGGRTAIGKGLREAIKVLTNDENTDESTLIMLITDGEENVPPFIKDVLPEVLEYNVIINAVAFGVNASEKLEHMTAITGGRGYFFSNNGTRPASALDSAFLESITSQADIELQPVQLKDEIFNLDNEVMTKQVYIDEELGKSSSFTVTSRRIERVEDVTLRSPSGIMYDATNPLYDRDDEVRQRIQIIVPEAEPGKWIVYIRRRGDHPISVGFSVTSEPKDIRNQPVRVRSWLNEIQLTFPAHAKVYSEVKKGYLAVIGATVTATVERPMGAAVDIELRDDGLGADVTPNDGVYAGYFTQFNGNGRYAVVARVSSDGQAKLKHGSSGSASPRMPVLKGPVETEPMVEFATENFVFSEKNATDDEEEIEAEPASPFDRSSNGGSLRLEAWTSEAGDVIPPGNVVDLIALLNEIESEEEEDYYVTLEFTTPGDDLDVGQVSSIEIRMSKDKAQIITNFKNAEIITEAHVKKGSLKPLGPGEKASVTIQIPESFKPTKSESSTIYYAVKAKDDAGSLSYRFNIASTTLGFKFTETIAITESHEFEEATEQTENHDIEEKTETVADHEVHEIEEGHEPKVDGRKKSLNFENEDESHEVQLGSRGELDEAGGLTGNKSYGWWPIIIGVISGITLLMLFVLTIIVVIKLKRKRRYSSVQSQQC